MFSVVCVCSTPLEHSDCLHFAGYEIRMSGGCNLSPMKPVNLCNDAALSDKIL